MGVWGKVLGGMAGFAVAGPYGALAGAVLGHAADEQALPGLDRQLGRRLKQRIGDIESLWRSSLRIGGAPSLLGRSDPDFIECLVVLAAKLAKCDGPVRRSEIDAFKRLFGVRPDAVKEIGRLFDRARDDRAPPEIHAARLAHTLGPKHALLRDILGSLFLVARADGAANPAEIAFLRRLHRGFGLDQRDWERASGHVPTAQPPASEPEAHAVLGIPPDATDEQVRMAWRQLVRDNHPDRLSAQGASSQKLSEAGARMARINAAWDRIKRQRRL